LPAKDHQEIGLLMSIMRVLSRNPALAADPTIPKVQSKQSAFMNILLKGLDNIQKKNTQEKYSFW
jgi:hypothetical protein